MRAMHAQLVGLGEVRDAASATRASCAPPSCSLVTSSWVTVLITSGPVMNMYDVRSTIRMKSVIAGEYTAPPAHGPMIAR